MVKRFLILALFSLAGCTESTTVLSTGPGDVPVSGTTVLKATCYMKDFEDFPEKVSGPVTLELKSFVTILVENKDRSESIEITFHKSKCRYGK